jgi:hypothetical protein
MPEGILSTDKIPDLSEKTKYVGQTAENSLVASMKVFQIHKVVFVLAKSARTMHREEIANRTDIPLASISPVLGRLKERRILVSPEWGHVALAKDFLRQFQLAYGTAQTEKLLKMFDEGGVDVAKFEFPLNEDATAPVKPSMLEAVKGYLDGQKKRLAAITAEIGRLTEERNTIAKDLASIGQLTASQQQLEMTL